MDITAFGHNLDSAPHLDIEFLDFQCAHCLCQLEKRDRSPNSLHLYCPNCSKSGIIERSTSLATECLRKGIQQDVSPTAEAGVRSCIVRLAQHSRPAPASGAIA